MNARPMQSAAPAAGAAIVIRDVTDADMPVIQAIYAHHVLTGLASFELQPPDLNEMIRRRDIIVGAGYPYVVAEVSGQVLGYAYASSFRPRAAYTFTVEDSVYISKDAHRQGIGRRLLRDIIDRCTALGYRQMVAVIGDSGNSPSIGLHADLGFEKVGQIKSVGYKFGRWVDSVIMQRPLGEGGGTLPKSKP
jgi:phosphinothricin acetyltransferase